MCFKERSKQTNLRDSLDSQTTIFLFYHFWRNIRVWNSENHQIKSRSSKKHHTRNTRAKIKSETSSLSQKSDLWSSILETFFSFENQLEHIFIDSCQFISFFNILDEINISFSKQWSDQKSNHYIKNFRSNFHLFDRIRIIYLLRKFFKIIFVSLAKNLVFFISTLNSISFYQKRQEFFNETLHQYSVLNLFFVFENSTKSHSII